MKKVVLTSPHWIGSVKHEPGETIELSDAEYEWYIGAIIAGRQAYHALAEQTPGTPEWRRANAELLSGRSVAKGAGE